MPTKSRRRDCLFGNIGDIGCEGDATEFDVCNTVICPHWTEWKENMLCTATATCAHKNVYFGLLG